MSSTGTHAVTISNNLITGGSAGIELSSVGSATSLFISNNTIDGADIGVYAFNDAASTTISGGTIENASDLSGLGDGVLLSNDDFVDPVSTINETVTLDHVTLLNNDRGVEVDDLTGGTGGHVSVALTNGTSITNDNGVAGTDGLLMSGPNVSVVGNTINDTAFSGQTRVY